MTSVEPASDPEINVDPEFQPLPDPDVPEPLIEVEVDIDSDGQD